MILMIDNYDSFTYNLVQYLRELGNEVTVYRNDQITLDEIAHMAPQQIVISPGPCTPSEAGISLSLIKRFTGQIPILGVCLGHQAIAQCFGGRIIKAEHIKHGKTAQIHHQQQGVFQQLPSPFAATLYNSLVADAATLADCLQITAWTQSEDGKPHEIMGLQHKTAPLYGVQFHPESILTEQGYQLLRNFLELARVKTKEEEIA